MSRLTWGALLLCLATTATTIAAAEPREKRRERAAEAIRQKNYKDAYADYRALALDPSEASSRAGEDLKAAIECLKELARGDEVDEMRDAAVAAHKDQWRLLLAAAQTLADGSHAGDLIGRKFFRGGGLDHKGQLVYCDERDRVLALRLLARALEIAQKETDRAGLAELHVAFARILLPSGVWNPYQGWNAQRLTKLEELPDYEEFEDDPGFYPLGAPVDPGGQPVFFHRPGTEETARNDGERWRWHLARCVELDPARKSEAETVLADFFHDLFDVLTVATRGEPGQNVDDDRTGDDGPFAVANLAENETLARMANGVKRFALPDEFNYIETYRSIAESDRGSWGEHALDVLGETFENRRQYVKAAAIWRQAIERYGPGKEEIRRTRLTQIVSNWGQFAAARVHAAGKPVSVEFRFRNARSVRFEAHEILVPKLIDDVKAYLKSRRVGMKFDYDQTKLSEIGPRLIDADGAKYLGPLVASWDLALKPKSGHRDSRVVVHAPLNKAGAYLVSARVAGGNLSRIIVSIADTVLVKKPTQGGTYHFVADATTGQPIPNANLEFFGYDAQALGPKEELTRIETRAFTRTAGPDGQLILDDKALDPDFDWLTIARTPGGRFAFVGLANNWYPYERVPDRERLKAFFITDRPIYRPGQLVKFKCWARRSIYDGPIEQAGARRSFRIKINNSKDETVFEHDDSSDEMGGFHGEYTLPKGAALGTYTLFVEGSDKNKEPDKAVFRVEEYRKPEFAVSVQTPAAPVNLGDTFTATVRASYYFGAPVRQARVKYWVTRSRYRQPWFPRGRWDWLYGLGYGSLPRHYSWRIGAESSVPDGYHRPLTTGPRHDEIVSLERLEAAFRAQRLVWSEQVEFNECKSEWAEQVAHGDALIGNDGTVKITVDTTRALEEFAGADQSYAITAEVTDGSRRTIVGTATVLVAARPFDALAWLDRGYYRPGQKIIAHLNAYALDHKPVETTGEATLFRIKYQDGKPTEEAVGHWNVGTDRAGEAELLLTAAEPGQYRLGFALNDGQKRPVERGCVFLVAGERFDGKGLRFNDLELIPDKREYTPGEKIRLLVNADRAGATVVLFVRSSAGNVGPSRILQLEGKSTSLEVDVVKCDVPNIFIEGLTIADGRISSAVAEILVPPEKKSLHVEVTASLASYRPGARANVTLKLTDDAGKPFEGSAALTMYDKGLEDLAEGPNIEAIQPFFWGWRREHDVRYVSEVREPFEIVADDGQERMEIVGVFGNGSTWGEPITYSFAARSVKSTSDDGGDGPVKQASGPAEIQPHVRKSFADTALWAPALTTNHEGIAVIGLTMPENLTTWKLRAWGMGPGTEVGEGETEVVTTKNLLVRLQAPRFAVRSDEIVLSANIHNNLTTEKSFRALLELEGPVLELRDAPSQAVRIKPGGEQRVDWKVRTVAEGEAIVRAKALGDEESDATEMRFPAIVHGQLKIESFAGSIGRDRSSGRLTIHVPAARRQSDSRVEIRYSPTLAGALVDALPYLADYPYGCTEQTLNRFLPTVITQGVLRRMGLDLKAIREQRAKPNAHGAVAGPPPIVPPGDPVFDDDKVRAMAQEGLKALAAMQLSDGAWGWFSGPGEQADAHLTALVVHGLQTARASDLALVPGLLERGTEWLKKYQSEQVRRLRNAATRTQPFQTEAGNLDALVFMVLSEAGNSSAEMLDFLNRDRAHFSVYGLTLFGLALEKIGQKEMLRQVVHTIEQYLVKDSENQTAYLRVPHDEARWLWYASDIETQACYLKLLARTDPRGETAPALVKYLLNNRRHATYWDSTRDTALCIEAMAEYLKASGEDRPEMVVAVSVDGKPRKRIAIGPDNLFSFDNSLVLTGDEVVSGDHTIEITRQGKGPVYFSAYVSFFTLDDPIRRTGLEIKVDRKLYRIRDAEATRQSAGARGQVVTEKRNREVREELTDLSALKSGDVVEVELVIESKNDYEYLLIEDRKAGGFEPIALRSGYNRNDVGAYMELRDQTVGFFTRTLSRGLHSVRYRVRAEVPGRFSALPAIACGMYAPELHANSDETKVVIDH